MKITKKAAKTSAAGRFFERKKGKKGNTYEMQVKIYLKNINKNWKNTQKFTVAQYEKNNNNIW